MVAVPAGGREPLSLIEQVVIWVAKRRARAGKASTGAVVWWVQELFGTVAAMSVAAVGAFWHAPPLVAWGVLAVVLFVLDAKVSGARRARRALAAGAGASVPRPASPRIVRE